MHNDRTRSMGWRLVAIGVVVALGTLVAGCGSSKSTSAVATTTNPAQGCPFSGTTGPTSGAASTQVAAALSKVETRKTTCIDNVQFDFAPGVPAWSVEYETGAVTPSSTGQKGSLPGKYLLVVQFRGVDASYAGPSTINPSSLNYVQQVTLENQGDGVIDWIISLDQKLQYTTSSSSVPPYFVLGIG
jgi:hypothetical protein